MWGLDLFELFSRGGPVMWPLAFCSILALAVALERMIVFLWRGAIYQNFIRRLQNMLSDAGPAVAKRKLKKGRSVLARVATAYLEQLHRSPALRQEIVSREASYQLTVLERRLYWLAVIGTLTPMLGLLGTVAGLVEAFHQIELLGGQVRPGDLASGIWAALLTTVFGLAIALPTLAVYHFLENRVGAVALQMQWLTAYLNEWLDQEPASAERPSQPAAHEEPAAEVGVSAGD